jgi:hypothetical protein
MSIKEKFGGETKFTDALAENHEWSQTLLKSCGIVGQFRSVRQHTIAPSRRLDNAWYEGENCIAIAESQCGRVDYDHMQKALDYASFANCKNSILICESVTEEAIKIFSGWPKNNLHLYLVTVSFGDTNTPLWHVVSTNNPIGAQPTKWIESTEIFDYGDGRIVSSLSDGISLLELLKNLSGLGIPEEFREATRQRVFASHIGDIRRGEIQTPRPLIEEMLDKIPEEFFKDEHITFFDPACGTGTFLVAIKERLINKYGHTEKNVLKRLYGMDKVVDNAILTALKLGSAKNIFADDTLLTEEVRNMKFDVIIGNPPYQAINTTGGVQPQNHNLWSEFSIYGITKWVSDNGIVSFVTPSSWGSPTHKLLGLLKENDFYYANTQIKHYFEGVGSTFSAWAVRKNEYQGITKIDGVNFNARNLDYFPMNSGEMLNATGVNIHYKTVMNRDINKLDIKWDSVSCHTASEYVLGKGANQTQEHTYEVFHTNAQRRYSSRPSNGFGNKKVVFTLSGYFNPHYDNLGNLSISEICGFINVLNNNEGNNLVNILESKLYQFIVKTGKWSGFSHKEVISNLPNIDFSKSWTDEELFKHFNISKKEVEYINTILGE